MALSYRSILRPAQFAIRSHATNAIRKRKTNLISRDLEGIARFIDDGENHIATLNGAGISREAGLPDFRSEESGIFNHFDVSRYKDCGLADEQLKRMKEDPTYVYHIDLFRKNPKVLINEFLRADSNIKPTLTHVFFRLLEQKNKLAACFTQNVDGLEFKAGVSLKVLLETHGNCRTASCIECHKPCSIMEVISDLDEYEVTICSDCKHFVKLDVLLWGEPDLPHVVQRMNEWGNKVLENIDMLLLMGTTCATEGSEDFFLGVRDNCYRVGISTEEIIPYKGSFDWKDENSRDIFVQGKSDNTVMNICEILGWKSELLHLYQTVLHDLESDSDTDSDSDSSGRSI